MNIGIKYKNIADIVREKLTCSGHNFDHVVRVYQLCLLIAEHEQDIDLEVLIPSALLHDIARSEESKDLTGELDHAVLGSEMAKEILTTLHYDEDKIDRIAHCIKTHRFRTGHEPGTREAKMLFDADKLDALGAVGIARSFMLSGQFGQRLAVIKDLDHDISSNTAENGRLKDASKHSPFIEYETKFKKIPDKLYTNSARKIAKERLGVMAAFFSRLEEELNGVI